MTGMPAWGPPYRDDELWAVVAFLERLRNLAPDEYETMARFRGIEASEARSLVISGTAAESAVACVRCHGFDGAGEGSGAFPRLAGQYPNYLFRSLRGFADGSRPSGIMQPISRELTNAQMRAVAEYYAAIRNAPYPPGEPVDGMLQQRGAAIAAVGIPEQRIPACSSCHGRTGIGQPPDTPFLAGQYGDYLKLQLQLWKSGHRRDEPMRTIAAALSDGQIDALAHYYSSYRPPDVSPD